MKNLITLIFILATLIIQAQEADRFTENNDDRPRDPRMDQMDVVSNEILVKFRDDVQVNGGTLLKSAGIMSVDRLLQDRGIKGLHKLFPTETRLKSARVVKDPLGQDMVIPSLHNIYKIVLPQLKSTQAAPPDIFEVIRELQELPEVEYAEPNYIFSIGDFTPVGPEMGMLEAMEQPANYNVSETAAGLIPNDPLYNTQWGIPATKIDVVWNTTTGDESQVIGILDTGVDWTHPDLAANIWANPQEIPDNGRDDDGNGYIDDVRGWDFINHDKNPMDDNSHGTHVAGIAAAVGDNGIGIAGVNWKAKIMPIKVFQSSGRGDAATIAQGVTYAIAMGATVLNMSFGSYAESLTLKNALANAYATAILIAAAGNDGRCIGPGIGCAPMFPAAYNFVLGVEAKTEWSNFDQDGPVFSRYTELHNYELGAPGTGILSCVPGGNYRQYNGTSMATPLVAAAISLYRLQKQNESHEMLFGNFIHSSGQYIDLEKALNVNPEPRLDIVSYEIKDTNYGDGDGRPDAGETIELFVKVRNTWEQANDVKVGIELAEFEDTSVAEIISSVTDIGRLSAYANLTNIIPLKIKIANNVSNNRDITFKLIAWHGDKQGEIIQSVLLNIENGFTVGGIITTHTVWDSTKVYLVKDHLKISSEAILEILPGTKVIFFDGKRIELLGTIIAKGNPDNIITFEGFPQMTGDGIQARGGAKKAIFDYCKFTNLGVSLVLEQLNDSIIIKNSIFSNLAPKSWNGFIDLSSNISTMFERNLVIDIRNSGTVLYPFRHYNSIFNHNIITNNRRDSHYEPFILYQDNLYGCEFIGNSIYSNFKYNEEKNLQVSGDGDYTLLPPVYWGTNNVSKIKNTIQDFLFTGYGPIAIFEPISSMPSSSAHGHVWKVLVNGLDAQDEFHLLDTIGIGHQKFEVYFNRPMDTQYPPTVSMGVRYPYTQTAIASNGSWSADSTIYTVYGNVGLTTGDGINTIRVIGAKDTDHFEIPVEDRRFRVIVDAAGSASAQFQATPGLGKVDLEWNNNDLEDGLGYNMYRMEQINESTLSQPKIINTTLITDTLYTDYAVVPNKKYFYYYKILRTNLEETDSSKVVAAVPFTADKGDANGDLSVNVLDVTTIAAYVLNHNPEPFIFEAADVTGDGIINIFDIVATINMVLNQSKSATVAANSTVNLYLHNDTLFADAPVPIGAIQFDIAGVADIEEIERLAALNGFESGFSVTDNNLRLIVYSLTGKTIPAGNRIPLLRLKQGSGITQMIMGDKNGSPLNINFITTDLWNLSDLGDGVATLGQNYPNPFDHSTTIPVMIHEPIDEVVIRIVNINGQQVAALPLKNPVIGENLINWQAGSHKGLMAYILEIRRNGQQVVSGVRKMIIK